MRSIKYYLFLACFVNLSNLQAQSITITGPASPVTVKEGDDFATEVLGNPWDFNQKRDIGWEENFSGSTVNVSNGIWSGTNETAGGYVFPLFPGFARSLFSEGLEGDKSLPKLGINHKINASKYYYLSYRLNHSNRSAYAIYWEGGDGRAEYWPDTNSPRGASSDTYYHFNVGYRPSGYELYSFDMRDLSHEFEQTQGSWSGNPYAFRIDPSIGGAVGSVTQFDWIRLVDPQSAPYQTITWNSSSLTPFHIVTVYADTDNSGFDGTPIARFTSGQNPGTFTFPTAMLPPGDYYFYIGAQQGSAGNLIGTVTNSGYSARLRIIPKPSGYITAPSMTSGEEYSSSVVGNSWDFDSSTDIANLNRTLWPYDDFRQFSTPTFATGNPDSEDGGSIFAAVANPPINGATESDVQIHLNVSKANPIDTGKYRYLVYRIAIDENQYPTMHDKVSKGWVMRPIWWNGAFTDDHDRAKAHVLYEGWHNYGTDLADSSIVEYGSSWTSQASFDNLRLDPLETPSYTWFYMDYVRLYSENRAPSGSYDIKYNITDTGSGTVTTSIYYDTDNSGFDGTLITSIVGESAGNHTYTWNTSGLSTSSSYYVYIVLDNGYNTVKFYSPVHLKVGPYVAPVIPRPDFDFDGDGKSDQVIFRADKPKKKGRKLVYSTGKYFINKSGSAAQTVNWGDIRYIPIYADIDGDNKSDRGLLYLNNNALNWYFVKSSDGRTVSKVWGTTNDKVVIGDYNGNGTDEIAIYRNGQWWILDENNTPILKNWGQAGTDVPVPGDYDGDGKTDIAVFRSTDANWYIINSSDDSVVSKQWGLPNIGDIALSGDFTADGKNDLVIFRPLDGTWYVRNIADDSIIAQQWGVSGDIPLVNHDVNGDGVNDFAVYRPSNGTWYYNLRNGNTVTKQYGKSSDSIPIKVAR